MMPPPFLPLYDLFRTQRRRSACCSCDSCCSGPGASASRDQAPCCHSDHKVWVCAAAPFVYGRMALFATRGCCLLASMLLLRRPPPLTAFSLPNHFTFYPDPKHSLPRLLTQRQELLEVVLWDPRCKERKVFIFIYHPKHEKGT